MNKTLIPLNLRYVDKREAAEYLGCSPRFINLALANGSLRAFRPRTNKNFLRFRLDQLDAFMDGQGSKAAQPVS